MRHCLANTARRFLVFIFLTHAISASCDEAEFSKWAAANAVAINTIAPTEDFADLLPLKAAIGSSRLVALGEPLHGAHEPLEFRNRLVRFLVQEMGFTAVALESGFTESSVADAYVAGKPGDLQSVTQRGTATRYPENEELLQWMRDYNAGSAVSGAGRVRLYGDYITGGARLYGPRLVLDYALDYLARADPAESERIRASLGDVLPPLDNFQFGVLSPPALATLDKAIPMLTRAMAADRKSLIAKSSPEEYRWAEHNMVVARQVSRTFHLTTAKFFEDDKYGGRVLGAADLSMAENVEWIVRNEGPKGRVLVFAHDGHVINSILGSGYWASMLVKPPVLGWHLRRTFGSDLVIIATSSATGSYALGKWIPIANSIDDILSQVGPPRFYLDLRKARTDRGASSWLSEQHALRVNVDTFRQIQPSTAMDVVVYLGPLTPSIPFSR